MTTTNSQLVTVTVPKLPSAPTVNVPQVPKITLTTVPPHQTSMPALPHYTPPSYNKPSISAQPITTDAYKSHVSALMKSQIGDMISKAKANSNVRYATNVPKSPITLTQPTTPTLPNNASINL